MKINIFKIIKKCNRLVALKFKDIGILILLLVINMALSVALPILTMEFINSLVETTSINSFMVIMILYFLLKIIEIITSNLVGYFCDIKEFEVGQVMRNKLVEKLFQKDGEFYTKSKAGDLFATLDQDTAMIVSFLYKTLKVSMELCTAITMTVVLLSLQWELLVIMLLLIPFSFYINYICNKHASKLSEICREEYGEQGALTEEFISNAVPMIVFGIKKVFMNKFTVAQNKYNRSYKKLSFFNQISDCCADISLNFASIISTVFGGIMVFSGKMTIGVLVTYLEYVDSFISPLLSFATLKTMAVRLLPSLERIEKIWNEDYYENPILTNIKNYDIRFENVSLKYPNGKSILINTSLSFKSGNSYAIIGKSGEGKSTIINLLLGLWKPQSGTILIDDCNIDELNPEQVRECISVVSRDTFFMHDTILENLVLDKSCSEEVVKNVLIQVGLFDDIMQMPNGLYSVIGDRGVALSGGQRQRLAIARALIKDAPIIIFDEPTSALDVSTEQIVYDAIKSLHNKVTIIISHHESIQQIVDYVLKIENKKLIGYKRIC